MNAFSGAALADLQIASQARLRSRALSWKRGALRIDTTSFREWLATFAQASRRIRPPYVAGLIGREIVRASWRWPSERRLALVERL